MILWPLCEARLIQYREATSAANANNVVVGSPGPPDGKVWVILEGGYYPSVAETQQVSWLKYDGSKNYVITNPVSHALDPAVPTVHGPVEQGMEVALFPGEYIRVSRGDHTAGSTMIAYIKFVEIDLPLYTYDEPQVVKRQSRALSSIRAAVGGLTTRGGGVAVPPTLTGERGGRSGPLEK